MVSSKEINQLINQHKDQARSNEKQNDLHDSVAWKEDWFGTEGSFDGVDNGIVLSICLDGVNLFKKEKIDYSMWPITIQIDNLPPKIRKTCAGMVVLGIIPSNGSKEPKFLDPYLKLLIDELKALDRCTMTDSQGNNVSVSVRLYRYNVILMYSFSTLGMGFGSGIMLQKKSSPSSRHIRYISGKFEHHDRI